MAQEKKSRVDSIATRNLLCRKLLSISCWTTLPSLLEPTHHLAQSLAKQNRKRQRKLPKLQKTLQNQLLVLSVTRAFLLVVSYLIISVLKDMLLLNAGPRRKQPIPKRKRNEHIAMLNLSAFPQSTSILLSWKGRRFVQGFGDNVSNSCCLCGVCLVGLCQHMLNKAHGHNQVIETRHQTHNFGDNLQSSLQAAKLKSRPIFVCLFQQLSHSSPPHH